MDVKTLIERLNIIRFGLTFKEQRETISKAIDILNTVVEEPAKMEVQELRLKTTRPFR